jgi:prepilin-type N-terminal cleavage/methylation domain-containing protein
MRSKKNKLKSGFTLLEVLLSISLVLIMIGISVPILQSFQLSSEVDNATALAVRAIRSAQINAQTGYQDSTWGVRIAAGGFTVFKGVSYAARDQNFDQAYSIDPAIGVSGISEIVFTKMTGNTTNTGTITIAQYSTARNITINEKGRLTY